MENYPDSDDKYSEDETLEYEASDAVHNPKSHSEPHLIEQKELNDLLGNLVLSKEEVSRKRYEVQKKKWSSDFLLHYEKFALL